MEKGYIQVYTGNGKGKTTCMLGLALRASGCGNKIYIGQFLKLGEYSEVKAIRNIPGIQLEQFGSGGGFVRGKPSQADLRCIEEACSRVLTVLTSGEYDLVLLDEINTAQSMGLIPEAYLLLLMDKKPEKTELVLTGRGASQAVMDRADLVTEMREIKHYYKQGVPAREGIES